MEFEVVKKAKKVLRGICILVLVVSVLSLVFIFYQSYAIDKNRTFITSAYTDVSDIEESKIIRDDKYKNINSDYVGWLSILNTNINYPVVQGFDNSYYLKHDINKEYNYYGNLFMDYRDDENTFNTVIYGHNMLDTKMFGRLKRHYSSISNGKEHSIVSFANNTYKLVGTFYCKDTYDFAYPVKTESEMTDYLDNINKLMNYSLQEINLEDKLLLLSTCSYGNKSQRFVVVFKLEGGI